MKILSAINNENIVNQLKRVYMERHNENLEIKDVYYFKSLLDEVKKDKYDRIILLEELEPPETDNLEVMNNKIFGIIDKLSDDCNGAQIIFIASDRRTKNENFIMSLFNIGIYNMLLGNDRTVDNLIALINSPRIKKQAKDYIEIKTDFDVYKQTESIDKSELSRILMSFDNARLAKDTNSYIDIFNKIVVQYTDTQLKTIIAYLPEDCRQILYENSSKYRQIMSLNNTAQPNSDYASQENAKHQQSSQHQQEPREVVKEVIKEVIKEVPKEVIKEVTVERQVYGGTPKDYKKTVAFIGASCVGKTFIINSIAEYLSKQGIKVAILDLTNNKDEYFIYAINNDSLRDNAIKSLESLGKGINKPLKRGNINIYTGLPKRKLKENFDYIRMIDAIQVDSSVILIDCDYETPVDFLKVSDTVYLVQDMNMLGIQPITDYLREIKYKGVNLQKLKVIVNKYFKCSLTPKRVIESLSYYSNPEMTVYDELFGDDIMYYIVPFDVSNSKVYVEGLLDCRVNYSKFTNELKVAMQEIAEDIYQLGGAKKGIFGRK